MRANSRPAPPESAGPSGWRSLPGGVTAARGFLASGVAAGIKSEGLDLAIVFSSLPSLAAAVFTRNRVQAAPVLVSRNHMRLSRGRIRAVLLNSGCANACTGNEGMRDAVASARCLASHLGVHTREVLVASTGVIGMPLPIDKLMGAMPAAVSALSPEGGLAAVKAIMTTDTRAKTAAVAGRIRGASVRIGGMVKGAGMIHPQMATMLSVLTTDASVPPHLLDRIFRRVIERTFNCLSVDGDTSTNDTVILLANGASKAKVDARLAPHFESGLERVCGELARAVARDGEGATKFVEIEVTGAPSFLKARQVAMAIAHSPLVKTALYGEELNWGRILCAAGYSGVVFHPERVVLKLCGIPVFRSGVGMGRSRARAEAALKARDLNIQLDLGMGREAARVWTCDLSHAYVDINASYIS